jgi:outer membrane protein assembly factor BamD (BamD/ComL family)
MRTVGIILLAAVVAGCAPKTDEELFAEAVESQKASAPDDAIELYEELLERYPQSPRAPEAMYAIGTVHQDHKKDFPKAIASYRALVLRYPDHATAPNAAFLIGFIFHNEMKQLDSARVAYESFIAAYPQNPLVASAQFEIAHLGMDPAQILESQSKVAETEGSAKKRR